MTLLELCEPIFQYVCFINRAGRKSASLEFTTVRAEVLGLFEGAKSRATSDSRLLVQFKKVELPLIFFVDSMIAQSKLPCARQWQNDRLAFKRDELAGDEKFFDLLDETMRDSSNEAAERLTIYYTGIGLGFMGFYYSQPEYMRKKMQDISLRIHNWMESDSHRRICPEAYDHTDVRDPVEPPSRRLWLLSITLVVSSAIAFGWSGYLVVKAVELMKSLHQDASKQK